MQYRVELTNEATESLRQVGKKYGKKSYEVLRKLIEELSSEPDKKGEALRGWLKGLHSLHYSRFRVIYKIKSDDEVVIVVTSGYHASGTRNDIYALLERMIKNGAIDISKL